MTGPEGRTPGSSLSFRTFTVIREKEAELAHYYSTYQATHVAMPICHLLERLSARQSTSRRDETRPIGCSETAFQQQLAACFQSQRLQAVQLLI